MTQYVIRRLLIAIPSLLGISVILFTVLALAPGDPFEELATNPFLRWNDAGIRKTLGMEDASEEAVFAEIRNRKDNF